MEDTRKRSIFTFVTGVGKNNADTRAEFSANERERNAHVVLFTLSVAVFFVIPVKKRTARY